MRAVAALAVATIVGACGPGADEQGGAAPGSVPSGAPPARSSGAGQDASDGMLTLDFTERPLKDVVARIQEKSPVNLVMARELEGTSVTVRLPRPVPWREALRIVAERAGVEIVEESAHVFRIENSHRVNLEFENADIRQVISVLADVSDANILIAPEVMGAVTLRVNDMPWRAALDAAVESLGYEVVEDASGILRIGRPVLRGEVPK